MPWKMENGTLAMLDGNPIWVDNAGKDIAISGGKELAKIDELLSKRAETKAKLEELEGKVKGFEGLDATKAREAVTKLADLERKKLVDAGEVDAVRAELKTEFDTALSAEKTRNEKLRKKLVDDHLSRIFNDSSLFAEKFDAEGKKILPTTFYTPAHASRVWGDRFEFDDDMKPVAKYADGRPVLSKKNPGENADPQEALELLYAADPDRESYTRGSGMSGTGDHGQPIPGRPSSWNPDASPQEKANAIRSGIRPAA